MKTELKGKKLLVLGSTSLMCSVVEKAQELGIYVIVTDNKPLELAPAKKIADAYYDIDFSDTAKIKELVRTECINGCLTGFSDSYLEYYLKICLECALPCYLNFDTLKIATDKKAFEDSCIAFGIPTIPGITVSSYDELIESKLNFTYPVIVKPADNSGSRGVSKCMNSEALKWAYGYAEAFSKTGRVIVQQYMQCERMAVSYFAVGGIIRLSTTDDIKVYVSEETGSSITSYSEYPSRYTDLYLSTMNDRVIDFLKKNGFKDGIISFQIFVQDNAFYFCEMCYRLSGGHHWLFSEDANGIDQLALLLAFSVTGDSGKDWNPQNEEPRFSKKYAMLRILGIPGKTVTNLDSFFLLSNDKRIIKAWPVVQDKSIVGKAGTTAQVIGNILYRIDEGQDPLMLPREILEKLDIRDAEGNPIAFVSV